MWLGDPHGAQPWKTGWALSRYSVESAHDTWMGRQIHKAKYSDAPEHEKEAAADEIAGRLMGFIAEVYEDPGLPFSVCVAPPS